MSINPRLSARNLCVMEEIGFITYSSEGKSIAGGAME
jgi:hypothetical protein